MRAAPRAPPPLARANARIELARALASLGAPLCAGLLVGAEVALPFLAAALLVLLAAPAARRLRAVAASLAVILASPAGAPRRPAAQ